jgi:hypothetical protein
MPELLAAELLPTLELPLVVLVVAVVAPLLDAPPVPPVSTPPPVPPWPLEEVGEPLVEEPPVELVMGEPLELVTGEPPEPLVAEPLAPPVPISARITGEQAPRRSRPVEARIERRAKGERRRDMRGPPAPWMLAGAAYHREIDVALDAPRAW